MTSKRREKNINLVSFICLSFLVIRFSKQLLIKFQNILIMLIRRQDTMLSSSIYFSEFSEKHIGLNGSRTKILAITFLYQL